MATVLHSINAKLECLWEHTVDTHSGSQCGTCSNKKFL
jgi:hypothetical protein